MYVNSDETVCTLTDINNFKSFSMLIYKKTFPFRKGERTINHKNYYFCAG
jgi:hypothetical protein